MDKDTASTSEKPEERRWLGHKSNPLMNIPNTRQFIVKWHDQFRWEQQATFESEEAALLVRGALQKALPDQKVKLIRIVHEETEIP